ncbi:hypothetical protein [Pontibacter sp. G13]|uniref:hypothetical protein n=1 Tax=Pontibacter sp. G13 TaxID=3074898 RepID=UPI00288C0F0B|nr:hypothetical protein [Pontibacter sp. G13]WNJ18344.1 hypothetical protein RJD25_26115 [Pontibacter sp. G13]
MLYDALRLTVLLIFGVIHVARAQQPNPAPSQVSPYTAQYRPNAIDPEKGFFLLGYNGQIGLELQPVGFRIGYFGSTGVYVSSTFGVGGGMLGGINFRVLTENQYSMHIYTGAGIGDYWDEFAFEFGVLHRIRRLCLNVGGSIDLEPNLVFGVGYSI